MGVSILLLRLEGPLQSWGGRSRWDVRDTQAEPTKSGTVGLLGCALGYERGDARLEMELDAGLRFGVRVESPGRILEDFQTITDFLPTAGGDYKTRGGSKARPPHLLRASPDEHPATIISPRFYLEDAAFLVGLSAGASFPELLARCAAALKDPAWTLFLGRKACVPTRPIFDALTEDYAGLEEALQRHPRSWLGSRHQERSEAASWAAYIEPEPAEPVSIRETARQDAVRLNAARQYGFRRSRPVAPPDVEKGITP